jgi:transitional endoplasmic reticulum ATPase
MADWERTLLHVPPSIRDILERDRRLSQGDNAVASKKDKAVNDEVRDALLATLAKLGGMTVSDDALIYEGTRFVLPANMAGDIDAAVNYLKDYKEQQTQTFEFGRKFLYRPFDGAAAFQRGMTKLFGTVGIGKSTFDMFGRENKPKYITINTSHDETEQVPWGRVTLSPLEAAFDLYGTNDNTYGNVFYLNVTAPRKHRAHIEAFFRVVEDELKAGSLYRGKAFDGGDEPMFIDTDKLDPRRVVYSDDVLLQLDVNLWTVLRHTDTMRQHGLPLKRGVLIAGPYGTGKTLAGELTAREAVQNGWTFILARPTDNLENVLQTAQLYSPACVWFEDLDVVAQGHSDRQISSLLDSLDGIRAKGSEVVAAFTTNHEDKIQKGVLRPGRIDAVIRINGLDAAGYERLIRVTLPAELQGDIDFGKVAEAFDGFLPAFAKEAIDRATRYSISRTGGVPDVINTSDLVNAAQGLRPQLELMESAKEGHKVSSLDRALTTAVENAVSGMRHVDSDGDSFSALLKPDEVPGHVARIPSRNGSN